MADAAHTVTLAAPMVMCSSTPSIMSDSQKARRSNKPLMERRRRERINTCLNELKNLVLTAQRKDPSRYSKLEKADILEMTVRHVQALHRHEGSVGRFNTDATAKYRAGFTQCAAEVSKFLAGVNGLPADLHTRILAHLSSYGSPESHSVKLEASAVKALTPIKRSPQRQPQPDSSLSGVPLIQTRIASGQLALVLPSWTALKAGSSPPNTAASPDSAGAPSSPESARGTPHAIPDSHEEHQVYDTHANIEIQTSHLNSNLGPTIPSLVSSEPQVAPQMAPLDLATPHRRCGSASANSVQPQPKLVSESEDPSGPSQSDAPPILQKLTDRSTSYHQKQKCTTPTSSKSSAQCQEYRSHRHAPYPAHPARPTAHHKQNPHWRPW